MVAPNPHQALDRLCIGLAAQSTGQLAAALTRLETHQRVSALVATYNRCPFDPSGGRLRDNPLTWALDTLLAQTGDALAEVVVVDDGSRDHSRAVLDAYQGRRLPVPLEIHHLPEHRGAFAARNAAVAAASGDFLLFGDDDCLFPPHYAAGAAWLLHQLQLSDPKVCAVTLPFYYRALRPRETVALEEIGRLDRERAWYSTKFHCYPEPYLPDPPLLEPAGLHAPFPVEAVNGTCIIDALALRQVGGFADLGGWRTSYTDHLVLAAAFADAGRRIYHCPDLRLGAPHLKFGAIGRYSLAAEDLATGVPALGRAFGELVAISQQPREDTGCRVAAGDFLPEMLGSFLAFYLSSSRRGAQAWGVTTHRDFVQNGIMYTQVVEEVPPQKERRGLWRQGMARGARFAANHPPRVSTTWIQTVLDEITSTTGEARIRSW